MRCTRKDSKVQLVLDTKQDSNTALHAQQLSQQLQQMQYMQAFTLQALQGQQPNFNFAGNPASSSNALAAGFLSVPTLPPPTLPAPAVLAITDSPASVEAEQTSADEKPPTTEEDVKAEAHKPAGRQSLAAVTLKI